ncbi:MAG: DUF6491 family protein [Halieaceae bacterium]|jgi:hypothetical protein|nr:DUF6491 family protein [Halieaceae bacterium]
MNRTALAGLGFAAALLTACAGSPESAEEAESNPLLDITRYDPNAGENCIQIAQIRSSRVLDSQTIEFRMTGNRTFLNVLPQKCPGLRKSQPFGYSTSQSTLCNVDLITPIDPTLGMRAMGRCGLGKFYLLPETGPGPVLEDDDDQAQQQ